MKIYEPRDIIEFRKIVSKDASVLIRCFDDELLRKVLETKGHHSLILSLKNGRNSIRGVDSGFNHVLASLASKNGITLCFDMSELKGTEKREKSAILSKLMQNLVLCRKKKCKIKVINYKSVYDVRSLFLSLGCSTEQLGEIL